MKAVIVHSWFCILSFWAFNQKGRVQLTVEPEEVGINQPLAITINSNVEGDIVENWPSNFVKGYGIQSLSRYVQDVNTGKMVQEHVVVFTGTFNKVGKYKIGPFYVKAGNKTYTSNSVKVNVVSSPTQGTGEDISRQQLRQPAFGTIEVSATKIYEGEPLVMLGRVYARERTYGRPVLRRPFSVEGVSDVYPLQQTEMWENVSIKRKNYESFAFEKKVLFPVGSGTLNIQPFEIYLPFGTQDYNVVSSVPVVEVIPLPANSPSEFIGAVGEFSVEQNCGAKKMKQGDIIQVEVIVSGTGNLHAIETPVLPLPKGMNTYGDAEVKEDYIFNSQGAVGKVTYTYHIQVTKEGDQTIKPVKIAYFNPKEEKYVSVSAPKAITISVTGDPAFELQNDTDSMALTNRNADQKNLNDPSQRRFFSGENSWMWYGAGGLLLLAGIVLFLMLKPKKGKEEQPVSQKQKSIEKPVAVSEARELISQASFYLREKQADKFYSSIEKALVVIMAVKLKLPADTGMGRSEMLEELKIQQHASVPVIQKLLEKCDYARFGVADSEDEQEIILKQTEQLIG